MADVLRAQIFPYGQSQLSNSSPTGFFEGFIGGNNTNTLDGRSITLALDYNKPFKYLAWQAVDIDNKAYLPTWGSIIFSYKGIPIVTIRADNNIDLSTDPGAASRYSQTTFPTTINWTSGFTSGANVGNIAPQVNLQTVFVVDSGGNIQAYNCNTTPFYFVADQVTYNIQKVWPATAPVTLCFMWMAGYESTTGII